MKLSDIRGERALDIIADAMELAELIADDARFAALLEDMRDIDGDKSEITHVFFRHMPPILRDERYKGRITSIMAAASGVTPEEYAADGPMLQDMMELLLTDSETLGFLLGSSANAE